MHPVVQHVVSTLASKGVAGEVAEAPSAVPTAAAAAAQLGCTAGEIANSLIFSVDDVPLLVVSSGAHRVDTRRLAVLADVARRRVEPGARVRRAGHRPGGGRHRPRAGHPQPDPHLRSDHPAAPAFPRLWAGAGLRHTVFAISFDALLRVTGGEAAAVGEDLSRRTGPPALPGSGTAGPLGCSWLEPLPGLGRSPGRPAQSRREPVLQDPPHAEGQRARHAAGHRALVRPRPRWSSR